MLPHAKKCPRACLMPEKKRLQPCRITFPVYSQGGGNVRHSSALHMLLFPPASLVHAGRNALVMKQDADL